ncbi:MAG: N-acetylneuraminate synthase family protein [Curvibacter sp.]|jgi:sialic acid synthase SpsE|nr:N-acetylneuraminate synthase family protein [Curvibacter sp.]
MSKIVLRNDRIVGDFLNPYIVAELNTSHFGDMAIARQMVDKAKEVGCDCVKFQSWTADTLYAKTYYRNNPIAKRVVTKFSFGSGQLKELADYCAAVGIDFASTPYSREEAEFLVRDCRVPFVKVASMELNNLPYLTYLGGLGAPVVLSTGMGTIEEIRDAVRAIEQSGNRNICILHCVSVYPAPLEETRLQNVLGLRAEFPDYPIGYSDHTAGIEVPIGAVALGAALIEKHFTLDSSRIGMDNQMATEPSVMAAMVQGCRGVHVALGGASRILSAGEQAQRAKMRRSIVARHPLKAGTILQEGDLEAKRPGDGIEPRCLSDLVGKRLLVDVGEDEMILSEHLGGS